MEIEGKEGICYLEPVFISEEGGKNDITDKEENPCPVNFPTRF